MQVQNFKSFDDKYYRGLCTTSQSNQTMEHIVHEVAKQKAKETSKDRFAQI